MNHLLDHVTFTLSQGKIYALMGSNGAGKTTLFNIISGFITPQSGKIYFENKNLIGLQPYKINRQGVGRTFQDLRLITKLTVKENIVLAMPQNPTDNWLNAMLPENFYRKLNAAWEKKAEEIIEGFFLSEVKSSQAGNISYGQQKLLSLACCMANGASLLLLDEPVAGVQPEYRNKIAKLLKQLREDGKTILLIEHNTDFIAEVADKIFFLHEGKISIFNDMETLRKDKQAMEAYI
jgi:branched-chain amino acid transport system ATP-binding protein